MSTAFIVGATGAVGLELVKLLADSPNFTKVVLLSRRPVLSVANNPKFVQKIVDFEKLEQYSEVVKGVDVAFCALGANFSLTGYNELAKVERDYPLSAAKLAKNNGVKQFILVSSSGANENAMFLYSRTKGEAERVVGEVNFEKYVIMRPAMLEAKREKPRCIEIVGAFLLQPLKLVSNKYFCSATDVARAMMNATETEEKGKVLWDNVKIMEESKKYKI